MVAKTLMESGCTIFKNQVYPHLYPLTAAMWDQTAWRRSVLLEPGATSPRARPRVLRWKLRAFRSTLQSNSAATLARASSVKYSGARSIKRRSRGLGSIMRN